VKTATPASQKHFVESFEDYLDSVIEQAEDRDRDINRDVEGYFKMRRQNIGARPSFVPAELGLDLPDEAFYHPVVLDLSCYITDLIILDNDIASYNKEQASGDDRHNIITIVMRELNLDLAGAMAWAAEYHAEREEKFIQGLNFLPTFSPQVDTQLREYVLGLANWPRSNDCWNFESGRYFGSKGLEIQKTRRVKLMPKVQRDASRKTSEVEVTLVEL